ncbi:MULTISPECIES: hypothetical protein [unclassified Streptomyces]|uniref:hypothetical protein n=1 Tax=unclassified Streptomyces TaxID=2593676 RepID=UPI002E2DAD40|nr:hypothetical protein [Streptomyces sp. NBC_00223]
MRSSELHWHTSVVTGIAIPMEPCGVSPLVVREWRFTARSMVAATFDEPDYALAWLEATLDNVPSAQGDLRPVERAAYARERLAHYPPDARPGCSASGYLVPDLVGCRTEHGPGRVPPESVYGVGSAYGSGSGSALGSPYVAGSPYAAGSANAAGSPYGRAQALRESSSPWREKRFAPPR